MISVSTFPLVCVAGLALAFAAGLGTGQKLAHDAAALQALKTEKAQRAALDQAREEGAQIAAALQQQLQAGAQFEAAVTERISHAPLLTPRPAQACGTPGPARPAAGAPVHAAAGAGLPAAADGAGAVGPGRRLPGAASVPDAGLPVEQQGHAVADAAADRLTLAAVSLWNSALAGHDVPAGACSAADPASDACALDAGVDLQGAWRNHAANATSCAADRARYQHLIDYLQRTQRAPH